jgi:hypothetical protein
MQNLGLVLLVFAFVCACISVRFTQLGAWNMFGLALAFWIAAELFGGISRSLGLH